VRTVPLDDHLQLAIAAAMMVGLLLIGVRQLAKQQPSIVEAAGEWLYLMAGSSTALLTLEML
jgi:hypothetical protein